MANFNLRWFLKAYTLHFFKFCVSTSNSMLNLVVILAFFKHVNWCIFVQHCERYNKFKAKNIQIRLVNKK